MLDAALITQLKTLLTNLTHPIELVGSLDDSPKSTETAELLHEIASCSDLVTVTSGGEDARRPSFGIRRSGTDIEVRFAGLPMGHEFTSLVLALLQVGGHPAKITDELADRIRGLAGEWEFETFLSLSCQNCPDVVQALNVISVLNPRIRHIAIDGGVFPDEAEERGVLAVPTVFANGEVFGQGRMTLEEIVGRLDAGSADREAARLAGLDPFEVLVIGGGPAGAAAAIYAARKGIRTGLVTERFGGQVLDTMAIENFVSVPYTEGPTMVAAMEEHVNAYAVELIKGQQAAHLITDQGRPTVELANGTRLTSDSLVLATGARWRAMDVPGEEEYRNKGVTFCPHCDGPLFKGKRVAVIGGGNSGVEAAIDLAGLVAHVTLIEFDTALRADEVLQAKVRSLGNVEVLLNAGTTGVHGDGAKVTGLAYQDRSTGTAHRLDLDGVFVQIGLLPNTEWLTGAVEVSDRGEIIIDDRGRTSVPGVFAAGDCTTTPFKQIVVATGAGSTAALSAFDHLIRQGVPVA
ncbi:MAG: alkyl hydroperoxide reductase subunit F [Propionibacteriales bacterium]|nr:alkyl hydroperoxide reductase subunit F [Propionibacteriales bacterium]